MSIFPNFKYKFNKIIKYIVKIRQVNTDHVKKQTCKKARKTMNK